MIKVSVDYAKLGKVRLGFNNLRGDYFLADRSPSHALASSAAGSATVAGAGLATAAAVSAEVYGQEPTAAGVAGLQVGGVAVVAAAAVAEWTRSS